MAYVAISQQFMNEVEAKILQMKMKEKAAIPKQEVEQLSGTEPFLTNAIWGEYLHLKDQMPEKWKVKTMDLNLQYAVGTGEKRWRESEHIKTRMPVYFPPGTDRHYPSVAVVDTSSPNMQVRIANAIAEREVEDRWEKVKSDILAFFQTCKSVNEALKLWPQVEMYIPEAYVRRVNTKRPATERTESAALEKLKDMDTEALTAAAVIARMSK
jgi:hypothetical protein